MFEARDPHELPLRDSEGLAFAVVIESFERRGQTLLAKTLDEWFAELVRQVGTEEQNAA